jgi:hypothetical protein
VYVLRGASRSSSTAGPWSATLARVRAAPGGGPHALRGASQRPPRVLQISTPRGWECYLEDLFEAGLSVLTDGELAPTKINPIAARHGIHYDIPAAGGAGTAHIPQEPACTPPTSS